jgi:hypothetical protein
MKLLWGVYGVFCIAVSVWFISAIQARSDSSSLAVQLPNPPMNYQSDRFRAGNLDCSNAIGGGTTLEWGVTGVVNNNDGNVGQGKDIGLYARIVIPLDKPRSRINCDDLYQLELTQRRLEVQMLRAELQALQRLQEGGEAGDGGMEFEN